MAVFLVRTYKHRTVLNLIQSLLPRDKIRLTVAMKLGSSLQNSVVDPDLNFGNIYG